MMPPPTPIRLPSMTFGIVGSRMLEGNEYAYRVIDHVLQCNHVELVVSGGARGIDTMAVEIAEIYGIDWIEYLPEPDDPSRAAFIRAAFARNQKIVDASDAIVAIMVKGGSRGTLDTLRKAVKKGIPRVIVEVEK